MSLSNQRHPLVFEDFEIHRGQPRQSPSLRHPLPAPPAPTYDDEAQFQLLLAQLEYQQDVNATLKTHARQVTNNMFPSFLDSSSSSGNPNGNHANGNPPNGPRLAPSPFSNREQAAQQQQQQSQQLQQVNGNAPLNGGMNGLGGPGAGPGLPMSAGQQMDVNMLYQRVLELSDVLRENRARTTGIIQGAEELSTRAVAQQQQQQQQQEASSSSPSAPSMVQEVNAEISATRIAELKRQLAHEKGRCATILAEQKENGKLLGEYESAVGSMVEMVRHYSFSQKQAQTSLLLHYNKLLQEEKDAHLEARLEKDHWHVRFMQCVEMLREAYRLRCEEEEGPSKVVVGLQEEVRAYRNALGMEPEKVEEELGWEVLRDLPEYKEMEQG